MPPAPMFARLRACLLAVFALAIGACDGADRLTEPSDNPIAAAAAGPVSFSKDDDDTDGNHGRFRGGIPFGNSALPTTEFGEPFNGGFRNIYPQYLLQHLAAIKAQGGRVVLTFSGNPKTFTDAKGHFSLSMWKARVDRFKGVDFSSYVDDGTIISHYLIDEPHNTSRWNGKPVSPATVEEMAKYSKQLWPNLPTVVRAYPDYLTSLSGKYRYLDAAWAQYVYRFGDADAFIRKHVAFAQQKGLALIAGLNILKGGPDKAQLTPSQIKSWGSALLSSSQLCAFINWEHRAGYVDKQDIKEALAFLAGKARDRSTTTCRGSNGQTSGRVPTPQEPPTLPEPSAPPEPPTPPQPPEPPASAAIQIRVSDLTEKNHRHYMLVTWSGAAGAKVDLYRNGKLRRNVDNKGRVNVVVDPKSRTAYTFKICEAGSSRCSSTETAKFK